jgi:hypothetical protein
LPVFGITYSCSLAGRGLEKWYVRTWPGIIKPQDRVHVVTSCEPPGSIKMVNFLISFAAVSFRMSKAVYTYLSRMFGVFL